MRISGCLIAYPYHRRLNRVKIPLNRQSDPNPIPIIIRSFCPADQSACSKLYLEGLVGGKIEDNDTGYDIDVTYRNFVP